LVDTLTQQAQDFVTTSKRTSL